MGSPSPGSRCTLETWERPCWPSRASWRWWGEGECEEGKSEPHGFKYGGRIFMFPGFCPEASKF